MKNYPFYKSWKYENMKELVLDIEKRHSGKIAYSYKKKPTDKNAVKITFNKLAEDVKCLASAAAAHGATHGHVALIGKLSYGWVCTYLALLSCGTVVVPLDPDWSAEELNDTVKKADCTALFCGEDVMKSKAETIMEGTDISFCAVIDTAEGDNTLSKLIAEGRLARGMGDRTFENSAIDPEILALLVFTSGTTGKGKGVMLSQKAILMDIYEGKKLIDIGNKTIGLLPPHHTFGSTLNLLGNLMAGAEMYISSGVRYLPKELKEQKPTHLVLVPLFLETFYRKIMASVKDSGQDKIFNRMMGVSKNLRKTGVDMRRVFFKSVLEAFGGEVKLIVSGGAPLNQEMADVYEAIGVTIINGYGITECAPVISANRNKAVVKGSVGLPIECDEVIIRDPDENGEGEICVKGPNVMLGYYKDPEATAEAFTEDGYFRTGDYGRLDKDGWLYITGRLKNLIILSNGKNVYPEEIEADLSAIPGIVDVVVYEGISRRGAEHNAIVAEIFADEDYMTKNGIEDVHAYFKKHVETYNRGAVQYKRVGVIKVRDTEFPKNTLRKITRFKLDKSID